MDDPSPTAANAPATGRASGGLHILILDPLFQRADQPGSTRTYDLGRRLVEAGHGVTVLTTAANFGNGAGHVQAVDGINVTSIGTQARTRFGYEPPATLMGAFARAVAWRIWRVAQVDAVVATDRPMAVLPVAMTFCLVRGIPLILEAREGSPGRPTSGGALTARISAAVARVTYRLATTYARHVVALSRDIKDALVAGGLPEGRIVVSGAGCDTGLFAAATGGDALAAHPRLLQGTLVVHAGVMGNDSKLENMIDMAVALQSTAPNVVFAFCGDGPLRGRLEAKALERGVLDKNVLLLDPPRRQDLPVLLARAAVVISDGMSEDFYDGLAAGRPLVLLSTGWQQELIESRGAGFGLALGEPAGAARELADFINDADGLRRASQQAAALAAGRFALDRIVTEIRTVIEEAVAAEPRAVVMRRRRLRAKRMIDVLVSLAGLVVLSPVFVIVAIAVAAKMGRPIFFAQTRPGFKGKLFRMYKFRTMALTQDASGAALPDGERLTPLGHFLRRSSLDELPELINVLKGDMSLVGPRPLLPEYLPYYSSEQRRRHDMRPGVTGWSQVNGRNALTWEDKFALDVWYVDHFSLWLDIKIALKTVWVMIAGSGINAPGHATMPRFDEIMAHRQGAEDV